MLRNGICNKGFRNWRWYHFPKHLYGGLPSNIRYPYPLAYVQIPFCCIFQCVHAWFVYTHTFRQTLPMLALQHYQESRPFLTSIQDGRTPIIAPSKKVSSYALSG